jgi:pyrroline-5-carboxylate reductase
MKIALIGAGNMGEAILSGLFKKHTCLVCEARVERRAYLTKKYGVACTDCVVQAVAGQEVVILAVKPQDLSVALEMIKPLVKKQLFISIAAGITAGFIEKALGGKARVVRTMPNLPAMIGEGMTAVAAGKFVRPGDIKIAQDLLKAVGSVVVVPEKLINAVTAVSGSGPAYVFLVVECMMTAPRKLGFNEAEGKALVYQTLIGSAQMLVKSQDSAAVLRQKVTSKGGTTQAATDVFIKHGINSIFTEALTAARTRAKELAK